MTAKPVREIFINLPVADVKKSMEFFRKLGFDFNPQFTDEKAACMILNEHAYAMLLDEKFFKTFTNKGLCDARSQSEGIFCFSCESRQEVDATLKRALEAGGKPAMPAMDHGFMYGCSFYDVDDHHWEVMWMDPAAVQPAP